MSINPKHLRYLSVVAEAGSVLAASKVLNLAQPSLSMAIARLEDVVGVQLVERGRHGARLTGAGEILVRHARGIERTLENALLEIRTSEQAIAGPLVIGGTPLATAGFIPGVLSELSREFEPFQCRVIEGLEEPLFEGLINCEFDLVISSMYQQRPDKPAGHLIASEPLFTTQTSVVVRRGHPLAGRDALPLGSLFEALWVLPPEGSTIRHLIDSIFSVVGFPRPRNLIEVAPFGVLKEIVKQSDGLTILSDQIVRAELIEGTLIALPLQETIAPRLFGIHRLASRMPSPIAARFAQLARQSAASLRM